jgi:hypothetical protein
MRPIAGRLGKSIRVKQNGKAAGLGNQLLCLFVPELRHILLALGELSDRWFRIPMTPGPSEHGVVDSRRRRIECTLSFADIPIEGTCAWTFISKAGAP